MVWAANLEPADAGEHCEVGQTAQAKQNSTEGVDSTGCLVKQPPEQRQKKTREHWLLTDILGSGQEFPAKSLWWIKHLVDETGNTFSDLPLGHIQLQWAMMHFDSVMAHVTAISCTCSGDQSCKQGRPQDEAEVRVLYVATFHWLFWKLFLFTFFMWWGSHIIFSSIGF